MRRVADLLDDAEDCLGAAKDLLGTKRWAKACFLSQQGAKLAVKAALNALGKEGRRHDIHSLVEEVGEEKGEVLQFVEEAKLLDQYYIPTRYMNAFSEGSARSHFTERQAVEAVEIAERIFLKMREIAYEDSQ